MYDQARGNEPLVGAIATVAIHLGMLGHGSFMTGGDRDLAVTREIEGAATLGAEGVRWRLTGNVKPYYDFPAYVNRLPRISTLLRHRSIAATASSTARGTVTTWRGPTHWAGS